MVIYVAAAPKLGEPRGWVGSQYAPDIEELFIQSGGANWEVLFPPAQIYGEPADVFREVLSKIERCDAGIVFITGRTSGPLIEAGILAGMGKMQAIIAGKAVRGSKMLLGLPGIVGIADYSDAAGVRELLLALRSELRYGSRLR